MSNIQVNIWQRWGLLKGRGPVGPLAPIIFEVKKGLIRRSHTCKQPIKFLHCANCALVSHLCNEGHIFKMWIYLREFFVGFRSDSKVMSVWIRRGINVAAACWLTVCWFNVYAERERGREGKEKREGGTVSPLTHWTFIPDWQRTRNPPLCPPCADQHHQEGSHCIRLSCSAL